MEEEERRRKRRFGGEESKKRNRTSVRPVSSPATYTNPQRFLIAVDVIALLVDTPVVLCFADVGHHGFTGRCLHGSSSSSSRRHGIGKPPRRSNGLRMLQSLHRISKHTCGRSNGLRNLHSLHRISEHTCRRSNGLRIL